MSLATTESFPAQHFPRSAQHFPSATQHFPSKTEHFPSDRRLDPRLISELGQARSTLRATLRGSGSAVMVSAGGELDAGNESTWQALLGQASALVTPPGVLVVDVNGLDFVGCCAYAALVDEAHRCQHRGADMCLVSRQPVVSRFLTACGLNDLLPVYPNADSALSAATDRIYRRQRSL